MKKGKAIIGRISDAADLQTEVLPGRPIVELYSDQRLLIEIHRGIVEYGTQKIQVRVQYGILCVCGNSLEVVRMTSQQLVISGRIDAIQLIRGGYR